MASRALAAAVKSNLRALRISNHPASGSTGLSFSSCCAETHRPPLPLSLLPRRQQQRPEPHWQHRSHSATGRTAPVGLRCLSSTPAVSSEGPRPTAGCSVLSRAARAHRCHHQTQANQPISTSTSSSNGGSGELEIEVTHVDAANAKEAAAAAAAAAAAGDSSHGGDGDGGGGEREMMPEEDRQPIGAGSPGGGEGGEENVVRFLDVPGSEQTREEKMTIVFTCTVCETRTAKTFAKLSYERGVVIARCPGCHNLHLVADRLGWFEEAGDGAGGWDIQKITNRIGESDCHVVNEDNVMELNLVDIVGKTTKQREQPSSSSSSSPERGGDGTDSPQGQGSSETSK